MSIIAVRRQAITHGLFNGLQQILEADGYDELAAKVDELHHDYQDKIEEEDNTSGVGWPD